MKYTFNTLALLIILVSFAGLASARTQTAPKAVFPNSNTDFPINTGALSQIKGAGSPPLSGGGLSVGSFLAKQNAGFNALTYIEGVLVGNAEIGSNYSTLAFGDALSPVDLKINGTTYVKNGGMYSQKILSNNGGFSPLCAANNGDIILCPTPPPQVLPQRHRSEAGYAYIKPFIDKAGIYWPTAATPRAPNMVITLDTRNVTIDTLPGFPRTLLAGHIDSDFKGLIDNTSHIWTVAQSGTYDVSISGNGWFSTHMDEKSQTIMELSFYLKVNNTLTPLAPVKAGGCTNASTVPPHLSSVSQFIIHSPCPGSIDNFDEKNFNATLDYAFDFNKTMTLTAGDVLSLYVDGRGYGEKPRLIYAGGTINDMILTFGTRSFIVDVTKK